MAKVELSGISKRFGRTAVLEDISFTVADREFLALVGPSGCGKSTLLRIIAGLETQDSGSVFIDGTPVDAIVPRDAGDVRLDGSQVVIDAQARPGEAVRLGFRPEVAK